MDDVIIRLATESDSDSVIRIISEIVGEDAPRRYDWLYVGNPHGRALSWLAFAGSSPDPVGITSMFPTKVLVNGEIRVGAIGGDCYVMPAARRRGLATRVHEASSHDMRARGVEFMYGPPAPNNLKALVKAGSTEVAMYRRYGRPLTHRAVAERIHAALPEGMRNRVGRGIVAGVSVIPYSLLECVPMRAVRSGCRHEGAPAMRVPYAIYRDRKLAGLLILENQRPHMKVVDVLTMSNFADTRLTLALAIYQAKEAGCESISFEAVPAPLLVRRLFRLGFLPRESRGLQVACDGQEHERAFLQGPGHWHFTESDQDGRQSS